MKKILACLVLSLMVYGCNDKEAIKEEKSSPPTASAQGVKPAAKNEAWDFGDRFSDFNFMPKKFDVKVRNQKLILDLDYTISDKLDSYHKESSFHMESDIQKVL
ncbi:hypothetical protein SAMN04488137_1030 [Fictibacillus solisalsi]|uniref:Uncharacterized protein n=1 Tax=Fictibacillus solisalsi TaxID=459525 RepID=A0A1G9UNB4_9BACL|nr:hypothetical protein [Fictibacillus solisalsi]SDM61347.1 hypothetical protein SAMN04488137_1030 [Fictibacillus solisalsi]